MSIVSVSQPSTYEDGGATLRNANCMTWVSAAQPADDRPYGSAEQWSRNFLVSQIVGLKVYKDWALSRFRDQSITFITTSSSFIFTFIFITVIYYTFTMATLKYSTNNTRMGEEGLKNIRYNQSVRIGDRIEISGQGTKNITL